MTEHKLIFVGPVGSGKTTAISSLSDEESLRTDAKASDITGIRKQTTTVALDYGQISLSDDHKVRLYGTPGQVRFSFMWELLANDLAADSHSVVLLLDNTRNQPLRDLKFYTQEFAQLIHRSRLIIGVTRSDVRDEPTLPHYHHWAEELNLQAEIFFIDARRKETMLPLLKCALPSEIPESAWKHYQQTAKETINITESAPLPHTQAITPFQGDNLVIKESIVTDILNVRGVQGAVLANAMGDILTSSLDNPELEEYIGYMAGMVPAFQAASAFDNARSILVKSPSGNNLSIFIEDDQVLGVLSAQRTSVRTLKQQVEDILQWD